jgi:hypothetical protein
MYMHTFDSRRLAEATEAVVIATEARVTLHKFEIPGRPQKLQNKCQQCFRIHDERNADADTSAEFDDFSMREYLHINISTMEQIVASSVAESVHEDNIANSHDPRHVCL